MSNLAMAEERPVDTSQMRVSKTEVAIEIIGMNKWYADSTCCATSTSR